MRNLLLLVAILASGFCRAQVPVYSISGNGKMAAYNYSLFTGTSLTFHHDLFDSTLVARAGYDSVSIVIVDSAAAAGISPGAYTETMWFSFLPNGTIRNADYRLKHPENNHHTSPRYFYTGNSGVFYTEFPFYAVPMLYRYTPGGRISYLKTWVASQDVKTLADTTRIFNLDSFAYDSSGVLLLQLMRVGRSPEFVNRTECTAMSRKDQTVTCSYRFYITGLKRSDTLSWTETSRYDKAGRMLEFYRVQWGDTVIRRSWKYDTNGRLVYFYAYGDYYVNGKLTWTDVTIERGKTGLPDRIIYRKEDDVVRFTCTWK